MNQFMRESKGRKSRKPDFIDWLLGVKPFESRRSLRQFAGYYLVVFASGYSSMKWGLDSALTWCMIILSAWFTIDYYLEYRKL